MKRPQMQNPVISPAAVLFLGLLLFELWYPTASHNSMIRAIVWPGNMPFLRLPLGILARRR